MLKLVTLEARYINCISSIVLNILRGEGGGGACMKVFCGHNEHG